MENWGAAELRALFGGSADVAERQIMAGGQKLDVLFLDGLTSGGDIAEQVLRPLMQTVQPGSMQAVLAQAEQARVYCAVAERVTAPEDAADKLLHGYCAVVFPGTGASLCFETKTDTRRGPSAPESENTVKGAKDAFTETMRINTSLLRRHLRSAQLRFVQKTVGLRSQTAVTVCFLADLTDPALVRRMEQRLAAIDIDGMLTPASVEEYVTGSRKTAFPLLQYTERPDTFCQGLLNGQVGLLVDGLPLGYLAPVDLGILMKSTEDRAVDYISATCLRVLRYLALLAALLLPGLYVAMATYHQEMIPTKLLLAIIDSKQEVPFDTVFEVIGLLAAFELLQEAGLHLPQAIGTAVSIIGGLAVGTTAVDARLISPAALIVPADYNSFIQTADDYYQRPIVASFGRMLRYVASFLAVAMPGLYLAVTNFQTGILPTTLLMSFAAARLGVPFPAVVEVLLMELSFELLREAGVRLPGAMGNTIGIVGGLIIGQAAVDANIVSPIVVIVVAFTALCSFSIPNEEFAGAFRMLKFFVILMSAWLGFFGFLWSMFAILIHLALLKSFGQPYLLPFIGTKGDEETRRKDSLIRFPLGKIFYRSVHAKWDQKRKFRRKGDE